MTNKDNMNYIKIYNQIIHRGVQRGIPNCYYEKHHIIPKCLDGTNDKSNMVNLTAREHFISHWLLFRIYPENSKIAFAFYMMCRVKSNNQQRYNPSSRSFSEAKEGYSKFRKGIKKPERTGNKHPMYGRKGVLHPLFGKHLTEEQIAKWKESRKGYIATQETNKKISDSLSYGNCYKAKSVTCYTTGRKFSCGKELADFLKIPYSSVRRWLNSATPITFKYSYDQ
jgi:hypothetical protein